MVDYVIFSLGMIIGFMFTSIVLLSIDWILEERIRDTDGYF